MATTPPPPPAADVQMADGCTVATQNHTPPSSNRTEPGDGKEEFPSQQYLASLNGINLSPGADGTEAANMVRRSTRNSAKTQAYDFGSSPESRPAKRKAPTKVTTAKKTPKKTVWTAENLLTDPKSPLANTDLRTLLCKQSSWDSLTKPQRDEILALFPPGTRILDAGTENARPDFDVLLNDDNFRHDCATYSDNISQGKHDPEWLEQAWAARERRRMGDFDDFIAQKFEEEWGCEIPEGFKESLSAVGAGESKVEGTKVAEGAEKADENKMSVDVGSQDGAADSAVGQGQDKKGTDETAEKGAEDVGEQVTDGGKEAASSRDAKMTDVAEENVGGSEEKVDHGSYAEAAGQDSEAQEDEKSATKGFTLTLGSPLPESDQAEADAEKASAEAAKKS
ncbi:hypothetical protein CTRI78_v001437 [Colletotrichum trifolii]|uniref:DEUBAD domain-containing protein n=1 Tax=Colletotrichum trifolii TaxID=5466 RepID=A0A4R8RQB3_COLTR|nr:hypothetical protein CTRI78_v001437 [Colletotrichum trifolii]